MASRSAAVEPGALVLASASPRRRELLSCLGLPFTVAPADVDEDALLRELPAGPDLAETLAGSKAEAVTGAPGTVIIGADTLVIRDGQALGKPRDAQDAADMLRSLRNRDHQVITGVAVRVVGIPAVRTGHAVSTVTMRPHTDDEIAAYTAGGDPMDKAGAYAIQHAGFHPVARLAGCYWNVVGLPLCVLSRLLAEAGVAVRRDQGEAVADRCALCGPQGRCPAPPVGGAREAE